MKKQKEKREFQSVLFDPLSQVAPYVLGKNYPSTDVDSKHRMGRRVTKRTEERRRQIRQRDTPTHRSEDRKVFLFWRQRYNPACILWRFTKGLRSRDLCSLDCQWHCHSASGYLEKPSCTTQQYERDFTKSWTINLPHQSSILSKVLKAIGNSLPMNKCYFWTDSLICCGWIKRDRSWKQFVANWVV